MKTRVIKIEEEEKNVYAKRTRKSGIRKAKGKLKED